MTKQSTNHHPGLKFQMHAGNNRMYVYMYIHMYFSAKCTLKGYIHTYVRTYVDVRSRGV